ncbi:MULTISPECIES: MFS transporter [Acidiplasma]|jgi:MFS family permease|uniref:MFS transporter n=2 Tax=Acidiplasma TaxID=507753 RepID=A0A0Q0RPD6_9ARCH|nr:MULTISPECIES: MFS transporter [Acidiplasma]KQB33470.1 MFS transporter [Acidiplasma aeolicum]KQB34022.1 MFS transporter [Acidiplasma cupricumulans]WMT55346.1 MAG: MFS transporter [Acidiplasma sp.]
MDPSVQVEDLKWTPVHTLLFIAFSIGTTVEAYIYSLSYIATSWVAMPRTLLGLLAVWPPLWLLLGGAVSGPLADWIGRKKTLFITLGIYVIGAIGLIFSFTYITILIFVGLLLFAAGGEYNTILTATHELFPRRHRSRALFLELNFTNIGGSIAAILALLAISSIFDQRVLLGVTLLISILIMYIIRLRLPESVMWLEARGHINQAGDELKKYSGVYTEGVDNIKPQKLPSIYFRIFIGGVIGWAYTAGFSLIVLTLGPYFFPSLTDWLIFVFGLVAFFAGFLGLAADRFSRKRFLLISSVLVVIFAYLFIPTLKLWLTNIVLFWFLFIGVSVFINIYFLAEDTLKSEIWATRRRGLYSAIVRVISLGGSIPVIFLAVNLPIISYMWLGIGIFSTGMAASVAWYVFGIETSKGKSVRIWDEAK